MEADQASAVAVVEAQLATERGRAAAAEAMLGSERERARRAEVAAETVLVGERERSRSAEVRAAAVEATSEGGDAVQAGGLLRTNTRPTFNLLLLRASV